MKENKPCSDQLNVAVPIRVRGMSSEGKFFDEQTETDKVGEHNLATHLRNLVGLETEIYLTSLKTHVGGTFRVVWVNPRETSGFHPIGLELLDPEGDIWDMTFPTPSPDEEEVAPQIWLECQQCHQKLLTPVPEAQGEFLCDGFLVSRHCENCKATRPWGITTEPELVLLQSEPVFDVEGAAPPPVKARRPQEDKSQENKRIKGRAPIKMAIKVIRMKYGTPIYDVTETINVSRTGVYFLTDQSYDVGENVKVVLPYHEGDVAIPVPARVVRQDQPWGTFKKGVAIHLEK